MSLKVYTKTGDRGLTSLIGGTRVPKSDLQIEAYGTVDELNSTIGLLIDLLADEASRKTLREVQDRLFTIGSSLACDPEKEPKMRLPDLGEEDTLLLEREIDRMSEALPVMHAFLLPGGSVPISTAHIARCVCRRAERRCVDLQQQGQAVEPLVIQYLNRLSDHLFVMARYIGHITSVQEVEWTPRISTRPR